MTIDEQDPVTDLNRLLALSAYDLQSPRLRAALDVFASRAAEQLAMPLGLVSIVLDTAQYFAGASGLQDGWLAETGGTPVEWAFCSRMVRSGEPYVVSDAAVDPVQQTNPLVTEDGVRSYAGVPLVTPAGQVLGGCCVLGFEPREFTDNDIARLQVLAGQAMAELASFQR